MKPGASVQVRAAAQLYAPLIALFSLSLFVVRAPGSGIGFIAGLGFGLVFVLHALVFGAAASKRALPPLVSKLLLVAGVGGAFAGAALTHWRLAPVLVEAGLFAATAAASSLIVIVVFGRAPTLRDADW